MSVGGETSEGERERRAGGVPADEWIDLVAVRNRTPDRVLISIQNVDIHRSHTLIVASSKSINYGG